VIQGPKGDKGETVRSGGVIVPDNSGQSAGYIEGPPGPPGVAGPQGPKVCVPQFFIQFTTIICQYLHSADILKGNFLSQSQDIGDLIDNDFQTLHSGRY